MSARGRSAKDALEEAARAAFAEGFSAGSAYEAPHPDGDPPHFATRREASFREWWAKVKPRTCSNRVPECMGRAMQTMCTCTGRLRL